MRGPFENRTFRRLFAGRVITNVGDSLYFVGAMWLVYSLTGDPFYTGVAGIGQAVYLLTNAEIRTLPPAGETSLDGSVSR